MIDESGVWSGSSEFTKPELKVTPPVLTMDDYLVACDWLIQYTKRVSDWVDSNLPTDEFEVTP